MPIYEYECKQCSHKMEALQKMSDDPLRDCPECGKAELKKLVSAAGFRLKGAGWYETDFKSGSKKNLASNDSSKKTEAKKGDTGGAKAATGGTKPKSSVKE